MFHHLGRRKEVILYLQELGEQCNAHSIYKIPILIAISPNLVATVWPRTRVELEYPQYRSPNFNNIPSCVSSYCALLFVWVG